MKISQLSAALIAAILLPAAAHAAGPADTPVLDQRQANQERRIDQGIASGQLNAREAARLERGQQRIENMETAAKSDGVVTRKERAQLQHAQNVQSRHIFKQKHDRQ